MPLNSTGQVQTLAESRVFIQIGGSTPLSRVLLAGSGDHTWVDIGGASIPISGDIKYTRWQDTYRVGQFYVVSKAKDIPKSPEGKITFYLKKGGIPAEFFSGSCPITVYITNGACVDMSDFNRSWDSYVQVLARGDMTEFDLGDLSSVDKVDVIKISAKVVFEQAYSYGSIAFGVKAATTITKEIIDLTYGCRQDCGTCGIEDNGTRLLYAVETPATGAKPKVIYTTDYGLTFTGTLIAAAVTDELPVAITALGDNLVVLSGTAGTTVGGYYYGALGKTGTPPTLTKITTGFVAAGTPAAMTTRGRNEILIAGAAGYIYRSTNLPSGVDVLDAGSATTSDLTKIAAQGDIIVAAGADGAIVKSVNAGRTFATTTTSPATTGTDFTALWVVNQNIMWIGTNAGKLFYTTSGGESWVELVFPASGTGVVTDVKFVNAEVGYFLHVVGGASVLYATNNAGYTWTNVANRILNFPAIVGANKLAIPECGNINVAVNNLAVAGLGATADGFLTVGVPNLV